MTLIDLIVRDVAELPDRNSPDDQPELMMVTDAELRRILKGRLETIRSFAANGAAQGFGWGRHITGWIEGDERPSQGGEGG